MLHSVSRYFRKLQFLASGIVTFGNVLFKICTTIIGSPLDLMGVYQCSVSRDLPWLLQSTTYLLSFDVALVESALLSFFPFNRSPPFILLLHILSLLSLSFASLSHPFAFLYFAFRRTVLLFLLYPDSGLLTVHRQLNRVCLFVYRYFLVCLLFSRCCCSSPLFTISSVPSLIVLLRFGVVVCHVF